MPLRDFLTEDAVNLNLTGQTRDQILTELVGLLGLSERDAPSLLKVLIRREELGSTGVGRGVAIPHGRSLVVRHLRLAFGRHASGLEWQSIDAKPAFNFFLIVAPPVEIANQYLPVLGKIAQFVKEPDIVDRLAGLQTPQDFFALLAEKGV
jgi:PTS system nitrogen regulatory IIA component